MSEPVDIDDLPTFVAAGGQSIKERAQKFLDDEAARAEADKRREEQDRARAKELAARAVEPRPRGDFIVANFFRKRAVGLLVAAGSGGKTTFANHLCAHLAVGASVLGTVVTGAFKCFIAGLEEDQAQMDAFFSAAQHGVKAPDRKVVRPSRSGGGGAVIVHGREYWHGERVMFGLRHGKAPGPLTGWYLLRERALQAKAKMGRLDLLVIDSASLAFGGDVNDRGHVVAFLDLIAELADELDCAVLLLAHTNKSSRAGRDRPAPIGSTAWEDQVDFVLSMMPPPPVKKPGEIGAEPVLGEDADRIHLRVTKSNQGPIGIGVELTKVPFGSDAIRLEERQFPSAGELLVQAQKRAKADQLLVLREIDEQIKAGKRPGPAEKRNPKGSHLCDLSDDPKLNAKGTGKTGPFQRVQAALQNLQVRGLIATEEVKRSQGRPRDAWIITEHGRGALAASTNAGKEPSTGGGQG